MNMTVTLVMCVLRLHISSLTDTYVVEALGTKENAAVCHSQEPIHVSTCFNTCPIDYCVHHVSWSTDWSNTGN